MDTQYWLGSLISSLVMGIAGFLFGRRKYNKEVDNIAIANMQNSLEFYKNLSDDTNTRLEAVLKENAALREEIKVVSDENIRLNDEMRELRNVVDKLTNTLANYGLTRLLEDANNDISNIENKSKNRRNSGNAKKEKAKI